MISRSSVSFPNVSWQISCLCYQYEIECEGEPSLLLLCDKIRKKSVCRNSECISEALSEFTSISSDLKLGFLTALL